MQVFKSLGCYLLAYYLTEKGYLNLLFTFAKSKIRDKIVSSTVQPLREANKAVTPGALSPTVDNNQVYKTSAYTSYWSFANSPGTDDSVAVPAELASISVDVLIMDEYGQCNPLIAGVLKNRQNNSALESRPERKASTPGKAGTTIDAELKKCDYVFEAHLTCPHCKKLASLDPLKCFLKQKVLPGADGTPRETFFDNEMKAVDWHHSDPSDRINTAYLACEHCGGVLPQSHLKHARMVDRKSGMAASQFHEMVNDEPWKIRKVGLVASPFLRRIKTSVAVRFAHDAIDPENPVDFIQQGLGLATSDEFSGLTTDLLEKAILAPTEPAQPKLYTLKRVIGVDVARGSHYTCTTDLYIPKHGTKKSKFKEAIRAVRKFDRVASFGFGDYWVKNNIDFGVVDKNPEQDLAFRWTQDYKMIAVEQKHSIREMFREDPAQIVNGVDFTSYSINNQFFLNTVIKNFGRYAVSGEQQELIVRLPKELERDIKYTKKSSPVSHFIGLEFDEEKQMWVKPKHSRCDYAYSYLFVEVGLYHLVNNGLNDFTWLGFYA